MTKPVKFDFSTYTPAIFAIPAIREGENSRIAAVHPQNEPVLLDENSRNSGIADDIIENHPVNDSPNSRIAGIATVPVENTGIANTDRDPWDDRHYCRECKNLNYQGRCKASPTRYSPVDTHPRRCADYLGIERWTTTL